MAIKCYTGLMGSGKTYEVVSEVIFNAIKQGRRVVSNIAGLNFDAMRELCLADGLKECDLGEIVSVSHEDVMRPEFWRTDHDQEQGVDAFIQPGDLLALDEIWRFWDGFNKTSSDGVKRPDRVMNFFRMHRHFTHPDTGVACDVALIMQDIMDLSRSVRAVVEETYRMNKLTSLGLSKRYRVDVFQGYRTTGRAPLRSLQRTYQKKYFPLYSSHSQQKEGDAEAKEVNIDDRGNILKGPLFKFIIPVGLVVLVFCVYSLWGFFHPEAKKPVAEKSATGKPDQQKKPERDERRNDDKEEKWRIVGYTVNESGILFTLSDGGRVRFISNPPAYKLTGMTAELFLPNGDLATSWANPGRSVSMGERMVGK